MLRILLSTKISEDLTQQILHHALDAISYKRINQQLQKQARTNSTDKNQRLMQSLISTNYLHPQLNSSMDDIKVEGNFKKDNLAAMCIETRQSVVKTGDDDRNMSKYSRLKKTKTTFSADSQCRQKVNSYCSVGNRSQSMKQVPDASKPRKKRHQTKIYRDKQLQMMSSEPEPPSFTIDLLRLRVLNIETQQQRQNQDLIIKEQAQRERRKKLNAIANNIKQFNYDYDGHFYKRQTNVHEKSGDSSVIKMNMIISDNQVTKHVNKSSNHMMNIPNEKLQLRMQKQRLKQQFRQPQSTCNPPKFSDTANKTQSSNQLNSFPSHSERTNARPQTCKDEYNAQRQSSAKIMKMTLHQFKESQLKFYKFKTKIQQPSIKSDKNNSWDQSGFCDMAIKHVDVAQNRVNSHRQSYRKKMPTEPSQNFPKTSRSTNNKSHQRRLFFASNGSESVKSCQSRNLIDNRIKSLIRRRDHYNCLGRKKRNSTVSSVKPDQVKVSNQELLRQKITGDF